MQRITVTDDAVLDSNGHYIFADSNPPALDTIITAEWLNSVQEEICRVIEASGQVLDVAKHDQLLRAIKEVDAFSVNTTLTVNGSAPYPSLQSAIDAIRGRFIAPGVTVSIQMQTGMTHSISTPVVFTHRQGDQVEIKGDTTTPVTITCNTTTWVREDAALTVKNGGRIRLISGCLFSYDVGNPTSIPLFALKVQGGSSVGLGLGFDVNNFRGAGVLAEEAGVITVTSSTVRNTNTAPFSAADSFTYGAGFWARKNGVINAVSAVGTANAKYNFLAETGGVINATTCSGTLAAFVSRFGGTLIGKSCTSFSGSSLPGFSAIEGGITRLDSCIAGDVTHPVQYGYLCDTSSTLVAKSCSGTYAVNQNFRCSG